MSKIETNSSPEVALIRAVFGSGWSSNERALELLADAKTMSVDPLVLGMHRFGVSEAHAYERAARWCQLAFSANVPASLEAATPLDRAERLGALGAIELTLYGRAVNFCGPDFAGLIELRARAAGNRDLRAQLCIVPPRSLREAIVQRSGPVLLDYARQQLARRWPRASAHLDLTPGARAVFLAILGVIVAFAGIAPFAMWPGLVPFFVLLFVVPSAFRWLAVIAPRRYATSDLPMLGDDALPIYSVLIPLRDESGMVPQLARAMRALNYPPEKLDIKFVVEAASPKTVAAVRELLDDPCFELVVVPDQPPRTKPKALNFAMPFARGRYAVIFDAEDIPDPDQLRLAATRFAADPGLDCIQAELTVDNASENWLTIMFSAEYGGQFGTMLPALARWRLPMPLGGTSNHFRVRGLREVGNWDAFNVTEDADLGIRLARLRYRTATLSSCTHEEAPFQYKNWFRQRTRWFKGWMQTFIVHNRKPRQLLADMGWRNFLAFEIYVGSIIVSAPIHSIFLASLTWRVVAHGGFDAINGWGATALIILVFGYSGALALAAAGLVHTKRKRLIPWLVLLPAYWVLHSLAAFQAIRELMTRPYFWAKTDHGHTRMKRHAIGGKAVRSKDN